MSRERIARILPGLDALKAATSILDPDSRTPLSFLDWYELWLSRASDPDREQVGNFAEFQ